MTPFYKLFNSGNSDGAKKAWATRRMNGGTTLSEPLAKHEVASLRHYDSTGYAAINGALRSGTVLPEHQKHIDAIDSAMSKSKVGKDGLMVHRHLSLQNPDDIAGLSGSVLQDPTYASGSTNPNHFKTGNVHIHIHAAPGSQALRMEGEHSAFPSEKSVMFPRGARFHVTKVEKDSSGHTHIHAKHISTGKVTNSKVSNMWSPQSREAAAKARAAKYGSFSEGEGERMPSARDHMQQGFAHQKAGRDEHAQKSFHAAHAAFGKEHHSEGYDSFAEGEAERMPDARDHIQHGFAHQSAGDHDSAGKSFEHAKAHYIQHGQ